MGDTEKMGAEKGSAASEQLSGGDAEKASEDLEELEWIIKQRK